MQTDVDNTQFPPDDSVRWVPAKAIAVPLAYDKCVALGMGLLGRLGAHSPLYLLDTDLLKLVVKVSAEKCSVPDLPLPRLFDDVVKNYIKEFGHGLDYTIHHDESLLIMIQLPNNGHLMLVDAGPRIVSTEEDQEDPDNAAADTASNAAMYGDEPLALSPFNPGNVTVQFIHRIFTGHVRGWGVFDQYNRFETLLTLQDPISKVEFNDIRFRIEDVTYVSPKIYLPERIEYLRDLLNVLLRIAAPVIKEHWKTLPAEKRDRLMAGAWLNGHA